MRDLESCRANYLYSDLEEVARVLAAPRARASLLDEDVMAAWARWDSLVEQGAFFKALGRINWRVVPEAPPVPSSLLAKIQELGELVDALLASLERRLGDSAFLREELGFPACPEEQILWELECSRPLCMLRLDLALEAGEHPKLLEIQVVMGGLGISHALRVAYGPHPMLPGIGPLYEECLDRIAGSMSEQSSPPLAAVFGARRSAYRHEHLVLARSLSRWELAVAPFDAMRQSQDKGLLLPDGRKVAAIHRLFRSPNIFRRPDGPGRLVLQALLRDRVRLLNPWKDVLEDKRVLALVHHPQAPRALGGEMEPTQWARLRELVPPTWRATPDRIARVLGLPRAQRDLYLKKGRSFESRGLFHGRQLSLRQWEMACLTAKGQGDWVIQQAVAAKPWRWRYLDPSSGTMRTMAGYVRLCPFFFRDKGSRLRLADVLITAREGSSRVHGASDAVMVVAGPGD